MGLGNNPTEGAMQGTAKGMLLGLDPPNLNPDSASHLATLGKLISLSVLYFLINKTKSKWVNTRKMYSTGLDDPWALNK